MTRPALALLFLTSCAGPRVTLRLQGEDGTRVAMTLPRSAGVKTTAGAIADQYRAGFIEGGVMCGAVTFILGLVAVRHPVL